MADESEFWRQVRENGFEVDLHAQTAIAGLWTRALATDLWCTKSNICAAMGILVASKPDSRRW